MLRSADWHLFTYVSGQPIFLKCLTLEDETDRCPETSVNNYHSMLCNNPEGKEVTSILIFDHRGIFICGSCLFIYQTPKKLRLADLYIFRYLKKSPATQTPRRTTIHILRKAMKIMEYIIPLCDKAYRNNTKQINPLNAELNPICCLLALLGAHHFLHVSRIRVKSLTLRLLMSYIYIYIYIWSTHS